MTNSKCQCCHMIDRHGLLIYSTLSPECYTCFEACSTENSLIPHCSKPGKHRCGVITNLQGKAFLCVSDENHIKSSRLFKEKLFFYSEMLSEFSSIKNEIAKKEIEKTNRLFHNLTSLNAHSIQELYALASQKELAQSFRDQKKCWQKKLKPIQSHLPRHF